MTDERIYIRNQRFLPQWIQSSEQRNGAPAQHLQGSDDPAEQQVRPFYGPTSQRPHYDNRDFYHRRTQGHHTAMNPHMKLELLLRYRAEVQLHGSDTPLAMLLRSQIEGYDAKQAELPTIISVK